ncbi:arginine-tRNA ligase [Artemisia annua]|uniref:arginine--tRNA ligase n=1 Tax=Artemisia annua TaxID=35608 RepID=A0A2U1QFN4_ARTAN|nr:arginine-tRNA ligase [Artemisia annua]
MALSPSTNNQNERVMLRDERLDLFDESIKRCFPQLDDEFSNLERLKGDAQKEHGDYVCMNVLTICESLRRLDPHLFHQEPTRVIARKLLKVVKEENQKSKMIEKACIRDVAFITFRLSLEWMTERIKRLVRGGINSWAPVLAQESLVVDGPAPAIPAPATEFLYADEIRFRYIREMLIRMLDYSGIAVGTGLTSNKSCNAVREYFTKERGVIASMRHGTPLFDVKGEDLADNIYKDLETLWSAIYDQRGQVIVFVTPVRYLGYVKKCFDAAKDEKWLSGECSLRSCGYRTSSVERDKLQYLWSLPDSFIPLSLIEIGTIAGYTREASLECAIKYEYLKTHRLAECTLSYDDMFAEEGNTFLYLLKTRFTLVRDENFGGRIGIGNTKECFRRERELALHLVQFTEIIEEACLTFMLHPVCEYIWILCKKFISYYTEAYLRTSKVRLLWDATKMVMDQCFHLLGITPDSSRESSRSVPYEIKTGFEVIPSLVSDTRPKDLNPRFEMFSMSVDLSDSSFKNGALFGTVSLIDTDGLLYDERLPLNENEHGHVAYFYREWHAAIGIGQNAVVYFGSPSPCYIVPFLSVLEIYVRLFVTTADMSFVMCNRPTPINLSKIWVDQENYIRGTLSFECDDGRILMEYIALRDAVDTTMELSLESPNDPLLKECVSGCIFAYYDKMLDHLDDLRQRDYKAVIFEAPENDSELKVGPLPLHKSVMAVPVDGTLVFEAQFFDKSGKVILDTTSRFGAKTQDRSEWLMPLKNCFLKLTIKWSKGQVA